MARKVTLNENFKFFTDEEAAKPEEKDAPVQTNRQVFLNENCKCWVTTEDLQPPVADFIRNMGNCGTFYNDCEQYAFNEFYKSITSQTGIATESISFYGTDTKTLIMSFADQSQLTASFDDLQGIETINNQLPDDAGNLNIDSAFIGAQPISEKGQPGGYASLDSAGKLNVSQVPDLAISQYLGSVPSQAAMLQLQGQSGDWCVRSDLGTNWVITGDPSTISGWVQLSYPAVPVQSVNGKVGNVVLNATDVGAIAANPPVVQYANFWINGIGHIDGLLQVTGTGSCAQFTNTDNTAQTISLKCSVTNGYSGVSFKDNNDNQTAFFTYANSAGTMNFICMNKPMVFSANGGSTNSIYIPSSGNVLINTTTDNGVDKLQVHGNISSATGTNSDATVTLTNLFDKAAIVGTSPTYSNGGLRLISNGLMDFISLDKTGNAPTPSDSTNTYKFWGSGYDDNTIALQIQSSGLVYFKQKIAVGINFQPNNNSTTHALVNIHYAFGDNRYDKPPSNDIYGSNASILAASVFNTSTNGLGLSIGTNITANQLWLQTTSYGVANPTMQLNPLGGTIQLGGLLQTVNLAAPPSGSKGSIYYNSTIDQFQGFAGSSWKNLGLEIITGHTIYVDKDSPNATDSRSGLSKYCINSPFKTITAAISVATTYDSIYIRSGGYSETTIDITNVFGLVIDNATVSFSGDITSGTYSGSRYITIINGGSLTANSITFGYATIIYLNSDGSGSLTCTSTSSSYNMTFGERFYIRNYYLLKANITFNVVPRDIYFENIVTLDGSHFIVGNGSKVYFNNCGIANSAGIPLWNNNNSGGTVIWYFNKCIFNLTSGLALIPSQGIYLRLNNCIGNMQYAISRSDSVGDLTSLKINNCQDLTFTSNIADIPSSSWASNYDFEVINSKVKVGTTYLFNNMGCKSFICKNVTTNATSIIRSGGSTPTNSLINTATNDLNVTFL